MISALTTGKVLLLVSIVAIAFNRAESKPADLRKGRLHPRDVSALDTAKIVIYEHSDFKGASREITQTQVSLTNIGFNDRISSIKVFSSVWVGFTDKYCNGRQFILEEGEYPNPGSWHGSHDELSSMQRLNTDNLAETPNIILYEHTNYHGTSHTFKYKVAKLSYYNFNDAVSSLKVQTGTWILYEHTNYNGRQYIVTEGSYSHWDDWSGSNDHISSLRPVNEPVFATEVISMDFDIAAGLLKSTPEVVAQLSQTNDGSAEQQASWSTTRSVSTTKTYEWHWENSLAIEASTTFNTGVPFISGGEISLSITNTFTIGEKESSKNTESEKWTFNLPATVHPHTMLTVKAIIQQGKIDVPFKAVLKRGTKQWEERGTYKGTQSYNLHVDYTETPIE
ncbi:epidermal differentiation-specific protein-like [Amphiura filiformis]|uniref:epidermal differentiation-specific protein-like n=1 Tax=Amphiura filiformis TaxID=82378 RepID=UPI003B20C80E